LPLSTIGRRQTLTIEDLGNDRMSHDPEEDRMAASPTDLKELFAVTASTVHEIRHDVEQLKRDTAWLVQAVQAMLDHNGIIVAAPPTDVV
jgi:hypothetical protein